MPRHAKKSDLPAKISLTGHFSGVHLKILPDSGKLIVDLSEWTASDIEIITSDSVDLKNGAKNPFQVGDVVPRGLQKGWIIANFNSNGSIKLLEPQKMAPKAPVNWEQAHDHREEIRRQDGGVEARLWSGQDAIDIFRNLVHGRHNRKARLDTSGSYPEGIYWLGEESKTFTKMAKVISLSDGDSENILKTNVANVRLVQDVLEIEL